MFSKKMSRSVVSVLGFLFVLSLCIGLPSAIAEAEPVPCNPDLDDDCIFGCTDDADFTMDFRLKDCWFKTRGINPFFKLIPGYRVVLEGDGEKSVETVLCDTKWIKLGRRWIKTRVVEERALEENEDEELVVVEISRNYFAICKKTNAVYYFGELSKDCTLGDEDEGIPSTGGFDPEDESRCVDGSSPSTAGSWEAGVDGAMPGLIMPGTPLKGAGYFQEIAEGQGAVDRGEILDVGLDVDVLDKSLSGCIKIGDTNPSEGVCDPNEDVKLYCPGVGLVQDQELELVSRGFVGCGGGDYDDDDDDDDDD